MKPDHRQRGHKPPKHRDISPPALPAREDMERAERIRAIFEELRELNRSVPVIVEGKRDAYALRTLGFTGEVITFHRGQGMGEFCDEIAGAHERVVLLFDWDTSGAELMERVGRDLAGHWEEYDWHRERLRMLCQKDVKDIEGIPALLARLEGIEYGSRTTG